MPKYFAVPWATPLLVSTTTSTALALPNTSYRSVRLHHVEPVTNFGEKFGLLSVDCLGNESSLLDCSVDVIEEQCDAAGVVCSG